MKKFVQKIFLFLVFAFCFFAVQAYLLKYTFLSRVDFTLQNKHILVLGDSQAECAVNDSILNVSANLSNAGDPIIFNYIKLREIVAHNPQIDTLILAFSPQNLISKGIYEVPKVKSKIITYHFLMNLSDYWEIFKVNYQGGILGYTGVVNSIKNLGWNAGKNIQDMKVGAFRAIPTDKKSPLRESQEFKEFQNDELSVKYFEKIVELCSKRDIKLVVINTPIQPNLIERQSDLKNNYLHFIRLHAAQAVFLDFDNLYSEPEYFYDENHLNIYGANNFTVALLNKIHGIQ